MKDKFILISGSASYSCSQAKLRSAIGFLRSFTCNVLSRGGGLVVLGSDESSTKDEYGVPHIFDWIVLREVEKYAETTAEVPRTYARVVMSDEAMERKIDDTNLRLLANLEQRRVLELHYIQRERFTGGDYRRAQVELADAMLAMGGGKGTYTAGRNLADIGKPVLPLDLRLGSISDDGEGSVALHREMLLNPQHFFPSTHRDVINRAGLISLNRGVNDVEAASRVAVEFMELEFDTAPQTTWWAKFTRRLANVWQFVKGLPVVSAAIKIIESILQSIG